MAIGDAPKPSDQEAVPKIELRELESHQLFEDPEPGRKWQFAQGFEGEVNGDSITVELWSEPIYDRNGLDHGDYNVYRGWKNRQELTKEDAQVLWNKYRGSAKRIR